LLIDPLQLKQELMKRYYIILLPLLVLLSLSSCKKQVDEEYQPLVFVSLFSSNSSMSPGGDVGITADVTGTQVNYYWSYNSGTITGGGDHIQYTNFVQGSHLIICTVVDGAGEVEQKEVTITVQ
jgi:hypothetical protein